MRTKQITTQTGERIDVSIQDRLYVGGEFVEAEETFATDNPSTGDHLADLPIASTTQIDRAVRAAARASEEWREVSPTERGDRMRQFGAAIEDAAEELATLDTAENGSSYAKMRDDVRKTVRALDYYAGLTSELKGQTIPTGGDNIDFTVREPYGAVASILPFNHPTMFIARDLGPSLAAGNGIILKPSEYTSLSALYLAQVVDECGVFPDGLVNVVTGKGEVGATLVDHDDVGLITFRGSVATGRKVMGAAGRNLSPSIVELGGKNPNIVFPDADLDRAIDGAISGMSLAWQGQSCASGSRLFVHEDVYEEVVAGVVDGFESVSVGDPFDEGTDMGAIVSERQYAQVLDYIETAKAEGAMLLTGGGPVEGTDGFFVQPTVFEVTPEMTIACEEIFGPVLSVLTWSDYDEVVELANSVDYGLTASVWTNDLRTAHKTVERLDAGYVWVNQHGNIFLETPFGGFKDSGVGKHGGSNGLLDFTREKNVNVDLAGDLAYE